MPPTDNYTPQDAPRCAAHPVFCSSHEKEPVGRAACPRRPRRLIVHPKQENQTSSIAVIARSEATWQSVPLGCSAPPDLVGIGKRTDCHGQRPRNDDGFLPWRSELALQQSRTASAGSVTPALQGISSPVPKHTSSAHRSRPSPVSTPGPGRYSCPLPRPSGSFRRKNAPAGSAFPVPPAGGSRRAG